jgi:hypothetical protein
VGIWSRLFGRSPESPAAVPNSPFADRPPIRRVLYYLQHYSLREAAFLRHPRLTEVITAGRLGEEHAAYFWAKATHLAVSAGAIPAARAMMLTDEAARAALQEGVRLVAAVAVRTRRRDGLTAHLFVMPPPEHSVEAHFIAVVEHDNGPDRAPRYFTLEREDVGSNPPVLCEWTSDGRHRNLGARLEPDPDAFAVDMLSRVRAE